MTTDPTLSADIVVSSADPRSTFLGTGRPGLLARQLFVQHVRTIKFRGSAARVHLALNGTHRRFQAIDGSGGSSGDRPHPDRARR